MRQIEARLPATGNLNVRLIETAGILPAGTAYFSEPVPYPMGSARQRVADREAWFERARKTTEHCNVVFLDPDNGLEVGSVPMTARLAGKYATVPEIAALLESGAAVVLYQHGNRMPWQAQRERICAQISSGNHQALTIRTLRFGAYGVRAFFCITTSASTTEVVERGLDLLLRRTQGWDKSRYLRVE